ncbi:hypothetical protein PRK78_001199 [Emydomyces testavorans]|uniref:Mediator of RNA polymerase II transcription subunit 19 n=1 Tax=Emydomyces testavorans TaxID=2070801 RepID=A0AAF0IGN0_9EURO|nr:hypothetical protein PRK78_001199 [Emydomyces testavorans]
MLRPLSSVSFASVPHSPLLEPQNPQWHHRLPLSHPTAHLEDRAAHLRIPSSFMTATPQNYASSFSTTQSTSPAQSASQSAPDSSSPPSSLAMSTQPRQLSAITATNAFPTPASSVGGGAKDPQEPPEKGVRAVLETEGAPESAEIENDLSQNQEDPQQRQEITTGSNVEEDAMDIDQKDDISEDPNIAALQSDIGQAFHTCKTSYSISGPNPRFDLVSLYGLGPVAASVARTDPITGEKINRLRKSYEGKIKGLGLAGRNKPVKHEPGTPGGLRQLTMWPEEEWQNQKVIGKDIKVAEPDSALHKLYMRAMKMEPGPVPNNEYWEDVLGHEKPPKQVAAAVQPKKTGDGVTGVAGQPSQVNGTQTSTPVPPVESGRPKRTGKKRSYNDSSFVGYGEGFPDDEPELDGSFYSNSEEGGRSSVKKKRKKDHVSVVPPSLTERKGSYGVGMFGVGAR